MKKIIVKYNKIGNRAFDAYFEDEPGNNAYGASQAAAIGALVKRFPEKIGVEIELPE